MKRILLLTLAFLLVPGSSGRPPAKYGLTAAVLVSANAEWSVVKSRHAGERFEFSPWIEVFQRNTETVMTKILADLPHWIARASR